MSGPLRLILLAITAALSLLLAACGLFGNSLEVGSRARLNCSRDCTRHGQCGDLLSADSAVLANSSGPAMSGHDLWYPSGSRVSVVAVERDRELIPASGGVPLPNASPESHDFFQVQLGEGPGAKIGWVSEWCAVPD